MHGQTSPLPSQSPADESGYPYYRDPILSPTAPANARIQMASHIPKDIKEIIYVECVATEHGGVSHSHPGYTLLGLAVGEKQITLREQKMVPGASYTQDIYTPRIVQTIFLILGKTESKAMDEALEAAQYDRGQASQLREECVNLSKQVADFVAGQAQMRKEYDAAVALRNESITTAIGLSKKHDTLCSDIEKLRRALGTERTKELLDTHE